ncbi:unnamed protein product [Lymnaea stagnalis]|uniref:GRF-type domain-containing protein n=1 Tax=Lymnaea stagnalis TaxID=6523 RepID=A0AAV2IHY6_LYMST
MICDGCIMTLTKTLKMNLMSKVESPSLQALSLHSSKTKVPSNQKVTNAPFEIARDVGNKTSEQRNSCYNSKIKLSERNLNVIPMHVDEDKKADASPSIYNSNLNQQTDITLSETLTADQCPLLKMGSKSLKLPTTPVSRIPLPSNSSSSVKLRSLTFHNGVCNAAESKAPTLSGLSSASKYPAASLPPNSLSSNTSDNSCCLPVPLNSSRSGVTKTSTGMLQITRSTFTSFSSNSNKSHSSTTSESSAPAFTALKAIGHQPSAPPQVSGVKTLGLKASSSVNKVLPAPVHTSFKTPTSLDRNNSSLLKFNLNKSNGVNSSFKTPISRNMNLSLNMKATPPLCSCGRRSKRRLVQNQGPNTGRWFFTCSVASSSVSADKKTGCKFFQWESPVLLYS